MKSTQQPTLALIGAVTFSALYTVQAAAQTEMVGSAVTMATGSAGIATLSASGPTGDSPMAGLDGQEPTFLPGDDGGSDSEAPLPGLGEDNEDSGDGDQPSAAETVAPVTAGIDEGASEGAATFVETVHSTTDTVDTAAAVVDGNEEPDALAPEQDEDSENGGEESPADGSVHVAGEVAGPEVVSFEVTLNSEEQSLAVNDQAFPPAEEDEGDTTESNDPTGDDQQETASGDSGESESGNSQAAIEDNPASSDDNPPETAGSDGQGSQSGGQASQSGGQGSQSGGEEGGAPFGEAGEPIAGVTLLGGQASFELNAGEPLLIASLAGEEMSFPPAESEEDNSEEAPEGESSEGSPSLSEQVTPLTAEIDAAAVEIATSFVGGVNQTTDSVDMAAAVIDGDEEDPSAIAPEES